MSSFKFRGIDLKQYGVVMESMERALIPGKRDTWIAIPNRNGKVNASNQVTYDDAMITVQCGYVRKTRDQLYSDAREIAYLFSEEGELEFSYEPDKKYKARLISAVPLVRDLLIGRITLSFVCFPFALSSPKTVIIHNGQNQIDYSGTAETPCIIVLRNPNSYAVSNIQITAVHRR